MPESRLPSELSRKTSFLGQTIFLAGIPFDERTALGQTSDRANMLGLDLPEPLAAREGRAADEAAQADHAGHLLVAREGTRVRQAAELALHLDANGPC